MKLTRRTLIAGTGALGLTLGVGAGPKPAPKAEPIIGANGLYTESWFVEGFLDMKSDLKDAADKGKYFAVMWEQKGCPYCRETHVVNFAIPKIRDYIKAHFDIVELDMWGSRQVTDFDGKEMSERDLARRWGVNFTPTFMFFPKDVASVEGKSGREAEIFRLPGYFKPFHFLTAFEYVVSDKFDQMPFQRYVQAKGDAMRKAGKQPELWD